MKRTLAEVAADLNDRLISMFRDDSAGRRPVFGDYQLFQTDSHWHNQLWFHEYFHGDTGGRAGCVPPDRLDRPRRGLPAAPPRPR